MERMGPSEPESRLSAYADWLAAVIRDQSLDPRTSFRERFAPTGGRDTEGTWHPYGRAEDVPADRQDWRDVITISTDRAGVYVRSADGTIIRDPTAIGRLLADVPDLLRFALALHAEPMPEIQARNRRRTDGTVIRALLFGHLSPMLGKRAAARMLLRWEDELQVPWHVPGAAGLVTAYEAGVISAADRQRLVRAESAMLTSCRRGARAVDKAA